MGKGRVRVLTSLRMFLETSEDIQGSYGDQIFGVRDALMCQETPYVEEALSHIVYRTFWSATIPIQDIEDQFRADFKAAMERATEMWARGEL